MTSKGPPRRNLWRTVVLSLLVPFVVAAAIVTYNLFRLEMVDRKVVHLELADDVNVTLLELRRYEKNILLFRQDRDVHQFFENLGRMRQSLRGIESDVLSEMSSNAYRSLVEAVGDYESASRALIAGVESERRLEDDIRPQGRRLEKDAVHRDVAFEVRRYEKNYLIYGEGKAVERLRERAEELRRMQPSLRPVISSYLEAFGALVSNRAEKERILERMRQRGRDIQKITAELSRRERSDIDRTIAVSKRLSSASLLFLVVSLNVIGYLFSRYLRPLSTGSRKR